MNIKNTVSETIEQSRQKTEHWVYRIRGEFEFARKLATKCQAEHPDWGALVAQGEKRLVDALQQGPVDLGATVADIETLLEPLSAAAKSYTMHCVGHAHIDMNWMWSWPETVAVTNDTFTTVLALMDEYPEFCFSQSQASVYAILEEHNPELLARIAERVKEGRWEVTASHWVEGDKNMASGESLCRHLLYTRKYMKQLFGLAPEDVQIDWSPDTFGHAATVPNYLVRGGVKYLYLHRPGTETKLADGRVPEFFWWEGADGSRVLVRNDMASGYNGVIGSELGPKCLEQGDKSDAKHALFVYGVGDHGGGPTRRDLARVVDMQSWPIFPRIIFSTAQRFFKSLEKNVGKDLPVWKGELNTEFAGCYTSQSLIKKANRFSENRLVDSEYAATLCSAVTGTSYPTDVLEANWRKTLFSHFHDILPGSGVHDTRTYTHGLFQDIMASTSMIETQAFRKLAEKVDTSHVLPPEWKGTPLHLRTGLGGGAGMWTSDGKLSVAAVCHDQGHRPYVIFNTTGTGRFEVVEVLVWDNAPQVSGKPLAQCQFAVEYADGSVAAVQKLKHGAEWGHNYLRLAVPVHVPAFGFTTIVIQEVDAPPQIDGTDMSLSRKHHCFYADMERKQFGLENDLLRVEIDPHTGGVARLLHKQSGIEMITPVQEAPLMQYGVERPHGMTAWLVEHTGGWKVPEIKAVRCTERGPYVARIEVEAAFMSSTFTVTYSLHKDDPRLLIDINGTWFERGTPQTGVPVLRMHWPTALESSRGQYEIPFGAIDRDQCNAEEVPALQWARIQGECKGKPAGMVVMNDSKYGYALDQNAMSLTLLRASYDPDPLPEIGKHEVHLALLPYAGKVSVTEATARARQLNHPLRVIGTGIHKGTLGLMEQLLSVEGNGVIVSGIKQTEDGKALLVRLYEAEGKKTTATLGVHPSIGKVTKAKSLDMMEAPAGNGTVVCKNGRAQIGMPPHGIATVGLTVSKQNKNE